MIIYDHIMFHHSSLKRILGRFAHLAAALQCVSNARLKEWSLDTWKNDPPHGLMEIKFLTDINWYQAIRDINNDSHHCWLFPTSHHLAATTLRGAWMASTCYLWGGFWEVCKPVSYQPSSPKMYHCPDYERGHHLKNDSWLLRFQERQRQETGRDAQYCPNCQVGPNWWPFGVKHKHKMTDRLFTQHPVCCEGANNAIRWLHTNSLCLWYGVDLAGAAGNIGPCLSK